MRGAVDADGDGLIDATGSFAGRIGLHVPDPPSEADVRAAADLAARARVAFDARNEVGALADLERAFQISGDANIAGMLGLSLRAAGRLQDAWLAMAWFMARASADARARLEARVRAAKGELQAQLGGVRIAGDVGARGQVMLGGRVIAELPLSQALYLQPGSVRLQVRGEGRVAQDVDANVRAGVVEDLSVALPSASIAAAASVAAGATGGVGAAAPAVGGGLDEWPFVLVGGGLGVALLVAGVVATVVHDAALGNFNTTFMCGSGGTDPICGSLRSELDLSEAFQWVGFIGAGVGATVAIVVAILAATVFSASGSASAATDVDAGIDCDEPSPRSDNTRVTCAPWFGESAGGAGCLVEF